MGKNFLVKTLSIISIGFSLILAIPEGKNALIKDQRNHRNWHLINPDNCGLNNEFRIIGGVDAQLGQFPWIVRLGFLNKRNKMIFKCGGSIINSKYVVSAAHCFKTEEKLKLVRVGEHDESTNPDCDDDDNCAPPVADYEVESVTKHPDYDHPTLYSNDIALIRLVGRIEFNDYVTPICFEYGDLLQKEYVGQLGEVAGWGIYDLELEAPSSILQVVRLPIMRRKHCQELLEKKTVITQKQLCAGGVIGKDSCGGDSGGPLMLIDSVEGEPPRYYLIGLVSFGTKRCAKTNLPGVYTRIAYFIPWILDNIYP